MKTADEARRAGQRVVFVEFDNGQSQAGDRDYWKHANWETIRPDNIQDAARIMSAASSATVSRLHCAILGALVGTPTLVLGYHHKFSAVHELGLPFQTADPPSGRFHVATRSKIEHVRARGTSALADLQKHLRRSDTK